MRALAFMGVPCHKCVGGSVRTKTSSPISGPVITCGHKMRSPSGSEGGGVEIGSEAGSGDGGGDGGSVPAAARVAGGARLSA